MKSRKLLNVAGSVILSISFLVICPEIASAGVQYRTVEAKGIGGSPQRAVERALISGISQVNGAVISSRAKSALSHSLKVQEGKKVTRSDRSFRETIAKRTKGIVKSYKILDQQKDQKSGIYRVTLSVTVEFFQKSSQLKRLKMAVVPMRIRDGILKSRLILDFEERFRRVLENYLTQSRRFAMLDRSFIREQNNEFSFLLGKNVTGGSPSRSGNNRQAITNGNFAGGTALEELARIGNRVGTDYIVTGVGDRAYAYVKKTRMRTTGQLINTPKVGARVTYRILDVGSTQVKLAGTQKLHLEAGSLGNIAERMAQSLGQKIVNAIFPISVLNVDGELVTLGQGGDTVKNGAVYNLVRLGKRMVDPHTGESLGRRETRVGSVRVIDTQSKMSTGQILKLMIGRVSLLRDDFIVRTRRAASQAKKRARKMKDFEKDMDKQFEKD